MSQAVTDQANPASTTPAAPYFAFDAMQVLSQNADCDSCDCDGGCDDGNIDDY